MELPHFIIQLNKRMPHVRIINQPAIGAPSFMETSISYMESDVSQLQFSASAECPAACMAQRHWMGEDSKLLTNCRNQRHSWIETAY
jgi:hypothetical protein